MENLIIARAEVVEKINELYVSKSELTESLKFQLVSLLNLNLDLKHPISARIHDESIEFFTCVEAVKKGAEHMFPDFGSEISLTNFNSDFSDLSKFVFAPTLNSGSYSMMFGDNDEDYVITKYQMLAYISKELKSGGELSLLIQSIFKQLKDCNPKIYELSHIIESYNRKINKIEEERKNQEFIDSLKEGNIYLSTGRYSYEYCIDKMSDKTITMTSKGNTKRYNRNEAIDLLKTLNLVS